MQLLCTILQGGQDILQGGAIAPPWLRHCLMRTRPRRPGISALVTKNYTLRVNATGPDDIYLVLLQKGWNSIKRFAAWQSGSERSFYDGHYRKADGSTPTQASLLRPWIRCFTIITSARWNLTRKKSKKSEAKFWRKIRKERQLLSVSGFVLRIASPSPSRDRRIKMKKSINQYRVIFQIRLQYSYVPKAWKEGTGRLRLFQNPKKKTRPTIKVKSFRMITLTSF